jgi:hypothetical protein
VKRPPREALAHKLVVGVSLLAAAIAVASAFRGFPDLATHVRDDAFHEFAWARNLAAGNGPTVGAGIATSGVQPLWSLLLVVAAWWTDRLEFVAPILGILCHCAAAWLLRREGRGTWIGNAAALLWLGNPLLLRECQNGQETALACLCGVVLWKARRSGVARFALACAVATLARADLFLLALLLASTRRADRVFLRVSTVGFTLLPWLVFQRACGGSWLPDSAAPMAWLTHENFALQSPTTAEWWSQQWRFMRPALFGGPFWDASVAGFGALLAVAAPPLGIAAARFAPIVACAAAAAFGAEDLGTPLVASLLFASAPSNRASIGSARLQFLALAFALVGIVVVHDALRWHPRDYYFAPLALAGAVGMIALRRRPFAALLVAIAQLAQTTWMPLPLEPLAHQRGMQAMGAALTPLLGDGVVVGCFNSGIVSWEQLRHGDRGARVVNLDGVANAAAFTALRNARLSDYLDRQGARFLCDHPAQWSMDVAVPHANGPWFDGGRDPGQGLVEIARCVVPGQVAHRPGTEAFVLCWRRGRGEPPRLPARTQWLARTSDGAGVVWFCAKAGDGLDLGEGAREPWFTADRDGNYLVPAPRGARTVRMRGRDESIPGGVLR